MGVSFGGCGKKPGTNVLSSVIPTRKEFGGQSTELGIWSKRPAPVTLSIRWGGQPASSLEGRQQLGKYPEAPAVYSVPSKCPQGTS